MDICEFLRILNLSGESWILETQKGIIDTFIERVFFFALDSPTRSDDFSLIIKRDEYRHFRLGVFEESVFYFRESDHTLVTKIGLEDDTYESIHNKLWVKLCQDNGCLFLKLFLFQFNLRKDRTYWIVACDGIHLIIE